MPDLDPAPNSGAAAIAVVSCARKVRRVNMPGTFPQNAALAKWETLKNRNGEKYTEGFGFAQTPWWTGSGPFSIFRVSPIAVRMSLVRYLIDHPRIAGLLVCNFLLGMATSLALPFMPLWGMQEVGMTPFVFGLFMTATTLSGLVVSLSLARWSDVRGTRRPVMILGAFGGLFGYVGYAFVRDVALLMLIGCLVVSLIAVNFSQLAAYMREVLSRPENAGVSAAVVMSLLRAFFSLAWTVGPAIGAWMVGVWSYAGVFVASAGLFAAFLVGILVSIPREKNPVNPNAPPKPVEKNRISVLSSFSSVFRHRHEPILYFFAVFVLVFCAQVMSMMTLPLFVTQTLVGTTQNVGIIFGLAAFMEIPLMVWFAKLADRGHHTLLIRLGVILACFYFAVVPLARAPWHIYPMQFLIAVSIAITTNITILFFQDLLPKQKGVATAIYSNTWSLGSLIGYFAFGLLLPVLGHRGLYFHSAVITGLAAFLLLIRRSPETRAQPV